MSFSKSFSTTRIALLDVGGEEMIDTTPTTDVDDESELAAGVAQSEEIDGTLNAIDDGGNDIDELNGIADNLEAAQDDGGASPAMIQMAEVAVEHRFMSLTKSKVLPKKRLLPAQENFIGSVKTKKESTKIAYESIRTMAKNAGETIWKWMQQIAEFFSNLFSSVGPALDKAEARLTKLVADIRSGKVTFTGTARAIPGATWKALCIAGKFSKETIGTGVDKITAFLTTMGNWLGSFRKAAKDTKPSELLALMSNSASTATESNDDAEDVEVKRETANGPAPDAAKANGYLRTKWNSFVAAIKSFGSRKKDLGGGIFEVHFDGPLPGDIEVTVTGPTSTDGDLGAGLGATKVDMKASDQEGGEDVKVEGFKSESEAMGMIDKLKKLIAQAKAFLKGGSESANTTKTAGEELKRASMGDKVSSAVNKVGKFFRGIGTFGARCYNNVIKYVATRVSYYCNLIVLLCIGVAYGASKVGEKATGAATNAHFKNAAA